MNSEDIIQAVCDVTGVTKEALLGNCRMKRFTRPRYICWTILRDRAGLSCADIGRLFKRDHSTIIRGFQQFELHFTDNERMRLEYEAALSSLETRMAA